MLPFKFTPKTLVILLVRICLLSLLGWYLFCLTAPGSSKTSDKIKISEISFPAGNGVRKLAQELKSAGIIRSSWHFMLVSRLRGQAHRLQAGEYRFNSSMTTTVILRKLVSGDVDFRRFALPEGYSIYQVAELLEQKGYFKKEAFLEACRSPALLVRLGISAPSVEGYLFPATYNLPRRINEEQLLNLMIDQFGKKYARAALGKNAPGLSRHEVITLASLIEKEAVSSEEKPLISSVFHNRLRIGMPLQSDPTAVYGMRAFPGKVTKADIERPSSYNTYLIKGLPPAPIGNPGAEAIKAALHPAATHYLYFVARQDGTHQFSRTLDEHNKAVRRYLR